MKNNTDFADELLPEYDLKPLLKNAVRGKYANRYKEGTNIILLEPDVAEYFSNDKKVNEILRLVIKMTNMREQTPEAV